MERIIGINEARTKLTSLIDSMAAGNAPVIITVNSEPRSVLINYGEYRRLKETEKEFKRLTLKMAIEKVRSKAGEAGLNEGDVKSEIEVIRDSEFLRSVSQG